MKQENPFVTGIQSAPGLCLVAGVRIPGMRSLHLGASTHGRETWIRIPVELGWPKEEGTSE
jgi:hypothetical protein